VLPIFKLLRRLGDIEEDDWRRTFNLGIGMICVISQKNLTEAAKILKKLREPWHPIGEVVKGKGVQYR
jgi:phosphoribosylformylglycinamidine cyclo-ligase